MSSPTDSGDRKDQIGDHGKDQICLGDRKDQVDLLELILQKNTKTIQQEGHRRILAVGREAMSAWKAREEPRGPSDNLNTWLAVEEALAQIDQVHQTQTKLTLKKLRQEMERDQEKELLIQKQNYQTMAEWEMNKFFKNMDIRLNRLDKCLECGVSGDLECEVQQFDKGRRSAVRDSATKLKKRLRNEFALEKEMKIADNLRIARTRFREKTQRIVGYIEDQSRKETMEMVEEKTEEHQRTIVDFDGRSKTLMSDISALEDSSHRLSLASKDLSAEYKRLVNEVDVNSELVLPPPPPQPLLPWEKSVKPSSIVSGSRRK